MRCSPPILQRCARGRSRKEGRKGEAWDGRDLLVVRTFGMG